MFLQDFVISPADKGTGIGLVRKITLTWAFSHEVMIGNPGIITMYVGAMRKPPYCTNGKRRITLLGISLRFPFSICRMCPNNLASNVLELEWMVETREKQRDDYSSLSNGPCCILPRMHKDSLFCMQLRCAPCESCSKTCSPSLLCTSCHPTIRSTGGVSILRHTIVRDGRLCGPLLLEVTYLCTYVL